MVQEAADAISLEMGDELARSIELYRKILLRDSHQGVHAHNVIPPDQKKHSVIEPELSRHAEPILSPAFRLELNTCIS